MRFSIRFKFNLTFSFFSSIVSTGVVDGGTMSHGATVTEGRRRVFQIRIAKTFSIVVGTGGDQARRRKLKYIDIDLYERTCVLSIHIRFINQVLTYHMSVFKCTSFHYIIKKTKFTFILWGILRTFKGLFKTDYMSCVKQMTQ